MKKDMLKEMVKLLNLNSGKIDKIDSDLEFMIP